MPKWGWLLLVLLVTGLVYANSLPGTFYFDDFALMFDNPRVASNFSYRAFLEHYGGRPLTLLSLHWNYRLAGREPLSFHVVNLILHLLATGLLFLLAESWTRSRRIAVLAALLFALHPLQTQAVNYVWARSVLLMAVFGTLSLWLARRHRWLALAALQLAVWSRAEALVLVLPLAYVVLRPPRNGGTTTGEKSAWSARRLWQDAYGKALLAVSLLNLGALAVGLFANSPREVAWNHSDSLNFWLQQPAVLANYLTLMIWPTGFSIDHQWTDWSAWGVLSVAVLLAVAVGLLWRLRRSRPIPAYGLLGCVLLLLPAAVIPNTVLLSESRAYFSLAGFALAAAWFLDRIWRRHPGLAAAMAIVLLAGYSWVTIGRNRLWNDEIGIWQEAVERAPTFDRVRYNLGFALVRHDRTGDAEVQFELARNLNPSDDYSYAALGYCAEIQARTGEAERLYRQALFLNAGNQYARQGLMRIEEAEPGLDLATPDGRLLR